MEPQKRIVVLDSSSESAGALADYLSGEGFGVCAVSDDGNEGIKLIREYEPDVIVLSLVLILVCWIIFGKRAALAVRS